MDAAAQRGAVRRPTTTAGRRVNAVRQQIGNQASFDQRNYGYSTLTKLLAAIDLFEFADEGTSHVSVREKQARRAGASGLAIDWSRALVRALARSRAEQVAAAIGAGARRRTRR